MKQTLLVLAAAVVAGCATQPSPDEIPARTTVEIPIGGNFSLRAGQTGQLGHSGALMVRFDSVSRDSRCPSGVQCVWAGNAAVHLGVLSLTSTVTVSVPDLQGAGDPVILNTTTEPKSVDIKSGYRLTLVGLEPAARQGGLRQSEFVVTLRADRSN